MFKIIEKKQEELCEISDLENKYFESVCVEEDRVIFSNSIYKYELYHERQCCETVYIESINGDLADIEGAVIRRADHYSGPWTSEDDDDGSYNFYTIRTHKGFVDIRYNGSSNGYYSVDADLYGSFPEYYEISKDDFLAAVNKYKFEGFFGYFRFVNYSSYLIIYPNDDNYGFSIRDVVNSNNEIKETDKETIINTKEVTITIGTSDLSYRLYNR